MISTFVFSLISFFIVSTTTFIIISNQSKVKHLKNSLNSNKEFVLSKTANQDKKVLDLINNINLKHKDLQFENQKTKDEFKKKNTKVDNKINNLDKVFNSYKNITTANFMGMNNRVSKEVSRLDKNDDKLNKKIKQNTYDMKKQNKNILDVIDLNEKTFNEYKKKTNMNVTRLNQQDSLLDEKIDKINADLMDAVVDSSNLTYSARDLIKRDVTGKYSDINTSLNNFFGISSNNFIDKYKSVNSTTNINNNFNEWFDSNLFVSSRFVNFKSMNEMLYKTDINIDKTELHKISIDNLTNSNIDIYNRLDDNSNLYKHNFYNFMSNVYNFDLDSLPTISQNSLDISKLNSNIESLSNTLGRLGIFDPRVEGKITLDVLHETIKSNQEMVENNNTQLGEKLDIDQFNYTFINNLDSYKSDITSNLDESILLTKFENKDLETQSLNTNNITVNNDVNVDAYSLKEQLDLSKSHRNAFNMIFDVENHYHKGVGNMIDADLNKSESVDSTMVYFKNDYLNENNVRSGQEGEFIPKQVLLAPGVNLFVQRKFRGGLAEGHGEGSGGRIFVDSFDDIGLTNRSVNKNLIDDPDYLTNERNIKFSSVENGTQEKTLGYELSNLQQQIDQNKTDINTIEANNITREQLYKTINNIDITDQNNYSYATDNRGDGYGHYRDQMEDSFRIENLYTGRPSPNCAPPNNTKNMCRTVNERLQTLESSTDPSSKLLTDRNSFNANMQNYGSTIDGYADNTVVNFGNNNSKDLDMKFENIKIKGNLSVNSSTYIGGELSVNGNVYIGKGNAKIYLGSPEDLMIKDLENNDTSILANYVLKEDGVIDDINISDNTLTFTKTNGDTTHTLNLPTQMTYEVESSQSSLSRDYVENIKLNNGTDDKHIYNPKKFSYIAYDNSANKITLHNFDQGLQESPSPPEIIIPSDITRNSIMNQLKDGETDSEDVPTFKSIKIGDVRINSSGRNLQICDRNNTNCRDLWDHRQAPNPIT